MELPKVVKNAKVIMSCRFWVPMSGDEYLEVRYNPRVKSFYVVGGYVGYPPNGYRKITKRETFEILLRHCNDVKAKYDVDTVANLLGVTGEEFEKKGKEILRRELAWRE